MECETALDARNEECQALKTERDELFEKLETNESSLVTAKAEIVDIKAILLQTQVLAFLS